MVCTVKSLVHFLGKAWYDAFELQKCKCSNHEHVFDRMRTKPISDVPTIFGQAHSMRCTKREDRYYAPGRGSTYLLEADFVNALTKAEVTQIRQQYQKNMKEAKAGAKLVQQPQKDQVVNEEPQQEATEPQVVTREVGQEATEPQVDTEEPWQETQGPQVVAMQSQQETQESPLVPKANTEAHFRWIAEMACIAHTGTDEQRQALADSIRQGAHKDWAKSPACVLSLVHVGRVGNLRAPLGILTQGISDNWGVYRLGNCGDEHAAVDGAELDVICTMHLDHSELVTAQNTLKHTLWGSSAGTRGIGIHVQVSSDVEGKLELMALDPELLPVAKHLFEKVRLQTPGLKQMEAEAKHQEEVLRHQEEVLRHQDEVIRHQEEALAMKEEHHRRMLEARQQLIEAQQQLSEAQEMLSTVMARVANG